MPPSDFERAGYSEISADRELYRVQEFMDTLAQVERSVPNAIEVNFEDDEPVPTAIRRFQTYEECAEPTFFVGKTALNYVPASSEALSFSPRVARGGKRSFHGVFFGDLAVGESVVLPVAVKPHKDDALVSCLNDFFKNEAARELGFHTPPGVGFITSGERAYSLSILDETLTTLDSIDWSGFFPDTLSHPGMQEMWREISQQAAYLHSRGTMMHGDLAARNIATSADGGVFLIDWERARLDMRLPRDVEVSFGNSYGDLTTLLESMCLPPVPLSPNFDKTGIGIFYGKTGDWWKGFCEIFFDEYRSVRESEIDYRVAVDKRHGRKYHEAEVKEELGKLALDLRSMIEMERDICETQYN